MKIIEIIALDNGAHRNQTSDTPLNTIPDGWAVIPDDMECENFPFGEVTAEDVPYYREVEVVHHVTHTDEVPVMDEDGNPMVDEDGNPVMETVEYTTEEIVTEQEAYTLPTVTKWNPLPIPEPDPEPDPEPVSEDANYDELAAAIQEGVNEV